LDVGVVVKPLKPKGPEEGKEASEKSENESGQSRPGRRSRKGTRRNRSALPVLPGKPDIIAREDHPISRKKIDEDALKVLYRLNNNGHQAYIVGGGVRDLYLGKEPKDFDIATNASPDEVRSLFRNSRIIGRRFKLNHVYFRGGKIIEVATFRSDEDADGEAAQMLKNDNKWGDAETDALRRDLTINALFYDVETFSIIDYVGGIKDLDDGVARFIGDAKVRVQEDPVRMLRTLRHAGRVGFSVEAEAYDAITEFPALLKHCPTARLYEELLKDLRSGASRVVIPLYREAGLLKYVTPSLAQLADKSPQVWQRQLGVLSLIDKYVLKLKNKGSGEEAPPSVLMASLFLGNLPDDFFDEESDEAGEAFRTLFAAEPFIEGSESEEILQEDGRVYLSDETMGRLGKVVRNIIGSSGVSKKDCEYIERMLVLRMRMFEMFAGGQTNRLPYLDAFRDTLQMMKLTNQTSWCREAWDFWYPQREKYSKKNKRPNRRHK